MQSLRRFFVLIFRGSLLMPRKRLGTLLEVENRGAYEIFRETVNAQRLQASPVVMVVGFRLKAIGSSPMLHYLFQRVCIITTPFWSGLPGFYIKLWMVDPVTKNYAGIYEWEGTGNAQVYMDNLIPVLQAVSVKDSVWHTVYNSRELETYVATANGH